jgi:hypothetical protein
MNAVCVFIQKHFFQIIYFSSSSYSIITYAYFFFNIFFQVKVLFIEFLVLGSFYLVDRPSQACAAQGKKLENSFSYVLVITGSLSQTCQFHFSFLFCT